MSSLVSVIIPVFNAENFLASCIHSLLRQSYSNKEIIIVDDSSTDSTYAIAQGFRNESVKVFQQCNAGAAVARNTGLANAKGDYIQFMDVDDFLSEDKIEKQVDALGGKKNKVAVCNYINFFDGQDLKVLNAADQSSFVFSSNDPVEFLLNLWGANGESNFIQTNSWMVPRSVIEKSGGWRNYRCPDDDGEFFTRVLLASEGVLYVPGVYNYYRRTPHENKLSGNANRKYLHNTLLTIDLKKRNIERFSLNAKVRAAFAKQYLDYAVYTYRQQDILSALAYRKYKRLKYNIKFPELGGKKVEIFARLFGWRCAIVVKHYLTLKK